MAEPLKNQFGRDVPKRIAAQIAAVHPAFDRGGFERAVTRGYDALELMPRGRHIAQTLRRFLPESYPQALEILLASIGSRSAPAEGGAMASFFYLPHTQFVADFGLDHFEESMRAQYELTQRFTAEFCIRPFLERHRDATLTRLHQWANDSSPHVRRLVSEGTRPRLPWAPRLREFQRNPAPVLALLELLKDDPELYVRRSVANNLNDIGKDHPALLTETAKRWLADASAEREWVVRHALRSAVKRGDAAALSVLGYGAKPAVAMGAVEITPARAVIGESVRISFELINSGRRRQQLLVDFRIHFVKASGDSSPKVFKLKQVELAPGESVQLSKKVSLAELTTRRHYPGEHRVDVLINGVVEPLGSFELKAVGTRSRR